MWRTIAYLFAGYTLTSWGYCLVKGYDITLREWVSPLHPYAWPPPGGDVPRIPASQLWPTSAARAATPASPA
jgi:hypothetical protein